MRKLIVMLLVATPVLAFAADRDLTRPINTICPVDGMVVDASRAPIVVSDSTGRQADLVPLGVCTQASCADKVRNDPATYLEAARRDRIASTRETSSGGTSSGAMHDGHDGSDEQRTMVTTDRTSPGKAAHPGERSSMNDRPNALKLKEDFESMGGDEQIENDRDLPDEGHGEGTTRY